MQKRGMEGERGGGSINRISTDGGPAGGEENTKETEKMLKLQRIYHTQ